MATGIVGLTILVLLAALGSGGRNKQDPTDPEKVAKVDPPGRGPKHDPKTNPPGTKAKDTPPADPDPKKLEHTPVALAPLPRVIDFAIPPPVAAFVTDWVRIASYETRVTGVLVGPAPLQDRAGNDFWTPDPVLRVWVETRAVLATNSGLRRWGSTLNPALLTGPPGMTIPKAAAISGATLRGELYGSHKLIPGGPAVPDVLAFEVPRSTVEALVLTLDAEHLEETGKFRHVIRAEAWKKKQP